MASIKQIANAFFDGLSSLSSVLEPVQRPGSYRNLISNLPSPMPSRTVRGEGELRAIAARLRQRADLLDSLDAGSLTFQHAAVTDARPTHGAR